MKKILLSILTIGAVTAASAGATGAYFSASAKSSANSFSTGTMSVVLADDVVSLLPGSTAQTGVAIDKSYGGLNLVPGQNLGEQVVTLKNQGSIDGHHLVIRFNHSNAGPGDLAQSIIVDELLFGPTKEEAIDLRAQFLSPTAPTASDKYKIYNTDGTALQTAERPESTDGVLTLYELTAHGSTRGRIEAGTQTAGLAHGTEAKLWMTTHVDPNLTTQGLSIQAALLFRLDQDAAQVGGIL